MSTYTEYKHEHYLTDIGSKMIHVITFNSYRFVCGSVPGEWENVMFLQIAKRRRTCCVIYFIAFGKENIGLDTLDRIAFVNVFTDDVRSNRIAVFCWQLTKIRLHV